MQSSAREDYLTTEVMTATPQKLQLMLIDAAIRSIERTRRHWETEQYDQACETLIHAEDILGELLAGLNHESGSDLVKKMSAIYICVLRQLVEAGYGRDVEKLAAAVKILQEERETWRQVCEKYGAGEPNPARNEAVSFQQSTTPPHALPAASLDLSTPSIASSPTISNDDLPGSGFSWEA